MAKKRGGMNLSAPKQVTWWIAVLLGVVGLLGGLGLVGALKAYSFWLVVVGWVLLVLGTLLEGL